VAQRFGKESGTAEAAQKFLAAKPEHYILQLTKLPATMARMDPNRAKEGLKKAAKLTPKGKDPIAAEEVDIRASQDGKPMLTFFFPKTAPIELEDKEVEFVTKMGPMEMKQKFKLADMVVGDKLDV
jgi:hypothetical protein